jgi:hypothetical protein
MFDNWKSNMVPSGTLTQTPIPKKPTPKWRTLLISTGFLLGSNLVAFPSAALITGHPPTDPWVVYASRTCPSPPGVPGIWEVFLFTEKNGGGECRSFAPGLYPYSDNLGIPDNSVKSLYVGASVRVALFKDPLFAGLPRFTSSYVYGGIRNLEPPWDKQISSMRVETDAARSCNDLKSGEFALITGEDTGLLGSDCIILPARGHDGRANQFPSSKYMGVWDDHIFVIDLTKANCDILAFAEPGYRGQNSIYTHGYMYDVREYQNPPEYQKISSMQVGHCY